jgi:hypothetical protein
MSKAMSGDKVCSPGGEEAAALDYGRRESAIISTASGRLFRDS